MGRRWWSEKSCDDCTMRAREVSRPGEGRTAQSRECDNRARTLRHGARQWAAAPRPPAMAIEYPKPIMRIAITGGTGFVGTAAPPHLAGRDHEVVLVSRGIRPSRTSPPGVRLAGADLTTGTGLAEAFAGCDAVVHLAAIIVERGRQTFDAVNRLGTLYAARAAGEAGVA